MPFKTAQRTRLGVTSAREEAEQAFLDAAERLLVSVGYSNITTRKLAEEAGLNHGLVHYYFGSMQELLVQVLERFTEQLIARQRQMYAAKAPFIEKWRTAMRYLEEDRASGYSKVWYELQALGWNDPEIRRRVVKVDNAWFGVVTDALNQAAGEYRLDRTQFPIEGVAGLVMTFNEGMHLRMLSGVHTGHSALREWIDKWLEGLEQSKKRKRAMRVSHRASA
jgi:AcrR family transcriptional regulator